MVYPIINTAIRVMPDALQVQWGMTIENGKLNWTYDRLELRLYCEPTIHLTDCKPTTDLFPTDKSSNMEASVSLFGVGGYTGGKSEARKRFFAGTMAQDANGQSYYPARIDVSDLELPEAGTIYPSVIWTPLDKDWLKNTFTVWVVIGRTIGGQFNVLYRPQPYTHQPKQTGVTTAVLPDAEVVPPDERVRHRGARPKLFILYAHANIGVVNPIARRLSDEFYYDVFIDYDGIRAGRNWKEELSAGIQETSAVLFMMTPESLQSAWCIAELNHAQKRGKLAIPLRLNAGIEPSGIESITALNSIQYVDFAVEDTENAWRKLITQLNGAGITVPPREIQLLEQPRLCRLHQEYLRRLVNEFSSVDLSYLLDAKPDTPISLLDVYVPLRLGVSFNIEVKNEQYEDWCLREVAKPVEKPEDKSIEDMERPKSVNGFTPDKETMAAWESVLKSGWDDYLSEHQQKQEEKPEDERKKLDDGTYYWKRIESETAPALVKYLVITGDPGSGKSTLLRHLALAMAGQQLEDDRASLDDLTFWCHPAFTPLFIPLRSLVRSVFPNPDDEVTLEKIFTFIREHILKPFGALEYEDFLRTQMNDGDVLFMLDGLDEIPQADERRDQVQAIVKELKTYDKCRMIVTSRPYAYYAKDWQLSDFGHVDLVALEEDRLNELAYKLFHAVLRDEQAVDQQIQSFNRQMERVPKELKASPLLFTLLASIWLTDTKTPEGERLPDTHGRIYRKCVEILIARWTYKDAEGQSTADLIGLSEADLRRVLELIAYRVHSQQRETDDAQFAGGEIMNALMQLKLKRTVNPIELIEALAQRSGIVIGKYENVYQFAHRSFQEHLSACYLAQADHFPGLIVTNVQQSPTQWRNVLELIPDEVSTRDLWDFVKGQLPAQKNPLPDDSDASRWWLIYYAGHWIQAHNLLQRETDDEYREIIEKRLVQALTRFLEVGALNAVERAEMGRMLANYGDPRPGVGLRRDDSGLPDIAWGKPVPPGVYTVGGDEQASTSLEQQEVTLDYTYKLAKYPVTYAQYQAFLDTADWDTNDTWSAGFPDEDEAYGARYRVREMASQNDPADNHPRDTVSWYQAVAFCRWLTAQYRQAGLIDDSEAIRLPTEIEWEIAARYPDGRFYAWGDEFDPEKANTREGNKVGKTSPVGMYLTGKNEALDLFDLNGNVWEWTLTEWESRANSYQPSVIRVVRGGSFLDDSHVARAAFRYDYSPNSRSDLIGFRVCVAPILNL